MKINLTDLVNINDKISDLNYKISEFKELTKLAVSMHFRLKNPLTIDELYALMTEHWNTQAYGNFKLHKTIFRKEIQLEPCLTKKFAVCMASLPGKKNLWVHILTEDHVLNKEEMEQVEAMGGYEATMHPVMNHMADLRIAMRDLLGDNVVEK